IAGVAAELLRRRDDKDGMVPRRNALRILVASEADAEDKLPIALIARDDPSEHVRQELARSLAALAAEAELVALTQEDKSPRVRGVAVRELVKRAIADEAARRRAVKIINRLLDREDASAVLRCAFEAIRALATGAGAVCSPRVFVASLNG